MDKLPVDKRVAAVLSAVLLIVVANAFVYIIYPTGRNVPRQDAHLDTPSPEQSAIVLLANADPVKGEKLAKKCEICHSLKEGGVSKVGPDLYGVVGRKVASVQGFAYSRALKDKDGEWTYERLDAWIQNPHEDSPNSKMTFTGMFTPHDRADLLAYLRTLSDNPAPLPGAPAAPSKPEAAPPGQKPAGPATGPTGAIEPQNPDTGQAMETPEIPSEEQGATASPEAEGEGAEPTLAEPGKVQIIIAGGAETSRQGGKSGANRASFLGGLRTSGNG